MSTTLDALWSIHGLSQQVDILQSTEFVARRGGRGFKFSFFYGPMWLLIFAVLGGWYFQYRKKNPDRARRFEQGLRGASASAAHRLSGALGDRTGTSGADSRHYGVGNPSGYPTSATNPYAHNGKRFNPPPNWPPPPPGWVPNAEWQPDPTWPPAPPGWQFWVA